MPEENENLSNLMHEERRFPPTAEFAAQANLGRDAYDAAADDRLAFWEKQAGELEWADPVEDRPGVGNAVTRSGSSAGNSTPR